MTTQSSFNQMASLPVIDIGPLFGDGPDTNAVAEQIRVACQTCGFFYVVGHGVEANLGDALEALSRAREFAPNPFLLEPTRRDGDWLLYCDRHVNQSVVAILALDGQPLRAQAMSVAVERYRLEQLTKLPYVRAASPMGTGEVYASVPPFRFQGMPAYSVVLYQQGNQQQQVTQLLHSSSREDPTRILLSDRPIRIMPNGPKFLSQLNTGFIDVWVRPECRSFC